MIIGHIGILLFTAAYALSKALADSRYDGNKNWHIWQTGAFFCFGLQWLNIVKLNGFENWWLVVFGWIFAQTPFEILFSHFRDKEYQRTNRGRYSQERTLHLNEIHSSLPLLRFTGWKMVAWDLFRISVAVGGYCWLR